MTKVMHTLWAWVFKQLGFEPLSISALETVHTLELPGVKGPHRILLPMDITDRPSPPLEKLTYQPSHIWETLKRPLDRITWRCHLYRSRITNCWQIQGVHDQWFSTWGTYAPPEDTWQCLDPFGVVINGRKWYWNSSDWGQGHCKISYNAENSPGTHTHTHTQQRHPAQISKEHGGEILLRSMESLMGQMAIRGP